MRRAATCLPPLRLLAALVAALAASACDPGVATPQEASQRVRDSYAWMADAELCPADLMRSNMRVAGLKAVSCADAGLPACFSRCRKGDVDACYWLANTIEKGDSGDPAAQALYQRACMLGEPSGCTNRAARMFMDHRKDEGVSKCVARTFQRTCELRDAWGCTMSGQLLHAGVGGPQDDARALDALAGACRNLDATAPACAAARQLAEEIRQAIPTASGGPGGP